MIYFLLLRKQPRFSDLCLVFDSSFNPNPQNGSMVYDFFLLPLSVRVTLCCSWDIHVAGLTHRRDLTVSLTVRKLCQTFMFPLRMNQDDFADHVSLSPTDSKAST